MTRVQAPWGVPHVATFEVHPAALLFPEMGATALADLTADIERNGVKQPIVFHDGKLLDGRNRVRAATAAGINPADTKRLPRRSLPPGENPFEFAWAANCMRLDYSPAQKAAIRIKVDEESGEFARLRGETAARANRARAEKAKEQPREAGGFAGPASHEATPGRDHAAEADRKTATSVAKRAQVSRATVERVQKMKREDPEAFEALASGKKKPKAPRPRRPRSVEAPTVWEEVPRNVQALAAFLKRMYSREECERLAGLLTE